MTADDRAARYLALAHHIAAWSRDPSTKVGAVLVRPDHTIASIGYNGFPRGVNDDPARLADRAARGPHDAADARRHRERQARADCIDRAPPRVGASAHSSKPRFDDAKI